MNLVRYDPDRHFFALSLLMKEMREEVDQTANIDGALAFAARGDIFCAMYFLPEGPAGFIIAQLGRLPWDSRPKVYEQLLFVRHDARSSSAAIRLVQAMEQWASEQARMLGHQDIEIQMQQRTGVDPERTRRFFEHAGYQVIGYNTRKHVCQAT